MLGGTPPPALQHRDEQGFPRFGGVTFHHFSAAASKGVRSGALLLLTYGNPLKSMDFHWNPLESIDFIDFQWISSTWSKSELLGILGLGEIEKKYSVPPKV